MILNVHGWIDFTGILSTLSGELWSITHLGIKYNFGNLTLAFLQFLDTMDMFGPQGICCVLVVFRKGFIIRYLHLLLCFTGRRSKVVCEGTLLTHSHRSHCIIDHAAARPWGKTPGQSRTVGIRCSGQLRRLCHHL